MVYTYLKTRQVSAFTGPIKSIDFETIGLLFGLFLVIGGITNMGVVDAAANLLAQMGGGNVFVIYTVIVWASVLFSAFIDNIPYVATMLPVVTGLAGTLGIDPTLLYFGLLSGATLGGNCTPDRRFGPTSPASASCAAPGTKSKQATSAASASPSPSRPSSRRIFISGCCSGKLHSSKKLPPAAPAYRAAGGALYAFVQPAILFRRNPLPLHPVQFADDFDHFFISQGQLFHFCPIHWNGEVEDNLPDPVAIWLLFREQLDSLDKCPHELFPLPLGSDFTGMIERQQQTTDHVRNKGVKVVC